MAEQAEECTSSAFSQRRLYVDLILYTYVNIYYVYVSKTKSPFRFFGSLPGLDFWLWLVASSVNGVYWDKNTTAGDRSDF